MAGSSSLLCSLSLVLCLAAGALSAPSEGDLPTANDSLSIPPHSIEAVPRYDFTLNNISSTIEQIFADANLTSQPGSANSETRSKRMSCACSTTVGAYGARLGTAFVDVPTNPCNVKITDIWVRYGGIVDAIQVRYNFPDGSQQTKPRRGGAGGIQSHISVPTGGKIIGLFGGVGSYYSYTAISQLRVLVLNAGQQVQIYGPFGSSPLAESSTFAVYGDIKSIFGYHRYFLDGLGVYYEPWGICGSPCPANRSG